jgi:hypothetical protein
LEVLGQILAIVSGSKSRWNHAPHKVGCLLSLDTCNALVSPYLSLINKITQRANFQFQNGYTKEAWWK